MLGHECSRRRCHGSAGLGHPVDRREAAPSTGKRQPQARGQLGLHGSPAKRDRADAAQVAIGQGGVFQDARRHRRYRAPHAHALALDQVQHLAGVKAAFEEDNGVPAQ